MTQIQPGQWRASQIEGLDVYNQNNEKIGDISEMLVDQSGKIQAVVIGVGGFLGIGERNVAIPFDQVKFVNEPRTTAATTTTGTAGAGGYRHCEPHEPGSRDGQHDQGAAAEHARVQDEPLSSVKADMRKGPYKAPSFFQAGFARAVTSPPFYSCR